MQGCRVTIDSMCFRNDPSITDSNERTDIVELLEAIAYLICQDDPVTPESYHRILSSRYVVHFNPPSEMEGILKFILIVSIPFRGVPKKILRLADTNRDGVVSVEEMMNFIINITNPK